MFYFYVEEKRMADNCILSGAKSHNSQYISVSVFFSAYGTLGKEVYYIVLHNKYSTRLWYSWDKRKVAFHIDYPYVRNTFRVGRISVLYFRFFLCEITSGKAKTRYMQMDRQTERQIEIQVDRQLDRQIGKYIGK